MDDLAEFADLETCLGGERVDLRAQILDTILVAADEILPTLLGQLRHTVEPSWIELRALVLAQKALSRDAMEFGEPHQLALVSKELLIDLAEMLDQSIDARLVEPERLHLGEDVSLKF